MAPGHQLYCSLLSLTRTPSAGGQALQNLPLCFTDEQTKAQKVREEEEALPGSVVGL